MTDVQANIDGQRRTLRSDADTAQTRSVAHPPPRPSTARSMLRRNLALAVSMVGMVAITIALIMAGLSGTIYRFPQMYAKKYEPLSKSIDIKLGDATATEDGRPKAGTIQLSNSTNIISATLRENKVSLELEDQNEPYLNRWQRRFASSEARNTTGGYLFFRHTRKAGGTSLRVYFRDVMGYHNITRSDNDWRASKKAQKVKYQVHYIEHEFQSIDWQCPNVDPRWQESMRIIVLRHPIERYLSEFFYSGAGHKFMPLDKERLYVDKNYTNQIAVTIEEFIPKWMQGISRGVGRRTNDINGKFRMIFGRFYTDNFQLRSLAGCSLGGCLRGKNVTEEQMEEINKFHPSSYSYSTPVPRCTNFYRKKNTPALLDFCVKPGHIKDECAVLGCDGPCYYPTVAWGEMTSDDVERAVNALKAFDAILLTEKLDEPDQSDFLSDVLGVPRDAKFALANRKHVNANHGGEKSTRREKTHFYRDMLSKLGLDKVSDVLHKDNEKEIEFFHHAEKLNEAMIERWKLENDNSTQ
ncbi:hypothetical protein ACHAWF_018695 [Thalassiosira exigua]